MSRYALAITQDDILPGGKDPMTLAREAAARSAQFNRRPAFQRRSRLAALFASYAPPNRDRSTGPHYLDADTGVPHGPQRYMHLLMVKHVMNAVCAVFGVDQIDLVSDRRDKHVMPARLAYYYLSRHLTTASFTRIARFCGNRDHTSAMAGYEKMRRLLQSAGIEIARDAALHDAARLILNADWGKRA